MWLAIVGFYLIQSVFCVGFDIPYPAAAVLFVLRAEGTERVISYLPGYVRMQYFI